MEEILSCPNENPSFLWFRVRFFAAPILSRVLISFPSALLLFLKTEGASEGESKGEREGKREAYCKHRYV